MARAVEADNSENAATAAQQICSASVKPSSFARFVCNIVGRCSPTKKIFRFFVGLLEIDVYKIDVGAFGAQRPFLGGVFLRASLFTYCSSLFGIPRMQFLRSAPVPYICSHEKHDKKQSSHGRPDDNADARTARTATAIVVAVIVRTRHCRHAFHRDIETGRRQRTLEVGAQRRLHNGLELRCASDGVVGERAQRHNDAERHGPSVR